MRHAWVVGVMSFVLSAPCWAGEIALTVPDEKLRWIIREVCDVCGGCLNVAEEIRAQVVADCVVRMISTGRVQTLEEAEMTMRIRFGEEK